MGLWKRIWSWNRDRKNGIGRENGIYSLYGCENDFGCKIVIVKTAAA